VRRALFIAANVALVLHPTSKNLAFGFINFGSLLAHVYVDPFINPLTNGLESLALWALLAIAMVLTAESAPLSSGIAALIALLVLLPSIIMLGCVAWQSPLCTRFRVGPRSRRAEVSEAAPPTGAAIQISQI